MPKYTEIEGCLIADRAECYQEKFKNIDAKNSSTVIDRLSAILRTKRWFEENVSEPFTIKALAAKIGIAESQLQRVFKQSEGISIVGYLQKRRMAKATELLRNIILPVISKKQQSSF